MIRPCHAGQGHTLSKRRCGLSANENHQPEDPGGLALPLSPLIVHNLRLHARPATRSKLSSDRGDRLRRIETSVRRDRDPRSRHERQRRWSSVFELSHHFRPPKTVHREPNSVDLGVSAHFADAHLVELTGDVAEQHRHTRINAELAR